MREVISQLLKRSWNILNKKKEREVTQSCLTLCDPMDCSLPGSSVHGIFQARVLGVSCRFLLQGIFPTQGLNLGLPHYRQTLYPLSHQGTVMIKDQFLQGHKLPMSTQEEIGKLNSPGSLKEIKFLVKNFPTKRTSDSDDFINFTWEFFQIMPSLDFLT